MNKKVLGLLATIGGGIGSYIPYMLGDTDLLSGWSILGGLIGGILGIWLGVAIAKRY